MRRREEELLVLDFINSLKADNCKAVLDCDNFSQTQNVLTNDINCYRLTQVKKRSSEEDSCDTRSGKRRRKRMPNPSFSTQRSEKQDPELEIPPDIAGTTPIDVRAAQKTSEEGNSGATSGSDSPVEDKGRTNLSNELRGRRISIKASETEEEEERGWDKEATMMMRSAVMSKCLEDKCSVPSLVNNVAVDDIQLNCFSGRLQRERRSLSLSERVGGIDLNSLSNLSSDPSFSMEDIGEIRKTCRVVLGENAKEEILSQPGTPRANGGTPKRSFSPDRRTPTGKPRKISTSLMQSPALRARLMITREEEFVDLPNVQVASSTSARMDARKQISLISPLPGGHGIERMSPQQDITRNQVASTTPTRMDARQQISLVSPLPGGVVVKNLIPQGADGEISWTSVGAMPKSVGKVKDVSDKKPKPCGRGSSGRGRGRKSKKFMVDEQQPLITGLLIPERKPREEKNELNK